MGLKKKDISSEEPSESHLGSWHANLIYIDGRKCLLFVNDKTLFNFIVPDVPRAQIRELTNMFKATFECILSSEKIPENVISKVMQEYESTQYANTNNKSVLGSMNDLTFNYKYHIQSEGGVHSPEVPNIIYKLNRMPMGALGFEFPIETLISAVEKIT